MFEIHNNNNMEDKHYFRIYFLSIQNDVVDAAVLRILLPYRHSYIVLSRNCPVTYLILRNNIEIFPVYWSRIYTF